MLDTSTAFVLHHSQTTSENIIICRRSHLRIWRSSTSNTCQTAAAAAAAATQQH
jgi:hypothetical protein